MSDALPRPGCPYDVDRLVEHFQADVGWRPAVTKDVLVERLTRTDSPGESIPEQNGGRRRGVGADQRVHPESWTTYPDTYLNVVGGFCDGTQDRPDEGAVSLLAYPRVKVVRYGQEIESGFLGRSGNCHELQRPVLLARERQTVLGHFVLPFTGQATAYPGIPMTNRPFCTIEPWVGSTEGKEPAMVKDHGPSIKDDEQYEALRREGMSKAKAARIANTPRSEAAGKGGKAEPYEDWTKEKLLDKAREVGIEGRSEMDKQALISALRNH